MIFFYCKAFYRHFISCRNRFLCGKTSSDRRIPWCVCLNIAIIVSLKLNRNILQFFQFNTFEYFSILLCLLIFFISIFSVTMKKLQVVGMAIESAKTTDDHWQCTGQGVECGCQFYWILVISWKVLLFPYVLILN